ncbi:MAG: 2-oxoacid:acceptor oxidoreductase family protein [Thermoplasmataceae archaeon]
MNRNILISGVGGQGVITAGALIAAAATNSGIKTVMSEIHGLSQRGGSVVVEVRMGDVFSPITPAGKGDVLIGFEPIETLRNIHRCSPHCDVIMNTVRVYPVYLGIHRQKYPDDDSISSALSGFRVLKIDPFSLFDFKNDSRPINSLILGATCSWSNIGIPPDMIEHEIMERFSGRSMERNIEAFRAGYKYGRSVAEGDLYGIVQSRPQ